MIRWFQNKLRNWCWRKAERSFPTDEGEDICCCGMGMSEANYFNCFGRCKSMRAYAVELKATHLERQLRQLRLLPPSSL